MNIVTILAPYIPKRIDASIFVTKKSNATIPAGIIDERTKSSKVNLKN